GLPWSQLFKLEMFPFQSSERSIGGGGGGGGLTSPSSPSSPSSLSSPPTAVVPGSSMTAAGHFKSKANATPWGMPEYRTTPSSSLRSPSLRSPQAAIARPRRFPSWPPSAAHLATTSAFPASSRRFVLSTFALGNAPLLRAWASSNTPDTTFTRRPRG